MSKSNPGHPRRPTYTSAEDEVEVDEEPVDTGLIRCICNSSEDDGFTIQCERCLVWQHAFCVKISQHNIPEHYLCDCCEKKLRYYNGPGWPSDLDRAVENDERTMKVRPRSELPSGKRKDDKSKSSPDKHHFRDIHNRMQDSADDDEYKPVSVKRTSQVRKNPVGRPPSKKPKLSKRIPMSKKTWKGMEGDPFLRFKPPSSCDISNFQPMTRNIIRSRHAKQIFKDARERWARLERTKEGVIETTATQQRHSREMSYLTLMDKGKLDSSIPKASMRSLSKALYSKDSKSEPRKGMFADVHIPANRFLTEINGDILLKSEYKFDADNDFAMLGTPCAYVFFYPTLDLCIDARHRGNHFRGIRRSCHPNAELRGIISSHSKDDQEVRLGVFTRSDVEKGEEITIGWNWQRGHISWKKNLEWHNSEMRIDGTHQVIDEEEERSNRIAVARMLQYFENEFVDCACESQEACFIEHLKRNNGLNGFDWLDEFVMKPRKQPGIARNGTGSINSTRPHTDSNEPRKQVTKRPRDNAKSTEYARSYETINDVPSRQSIISSSTPRIEAGDKTSSEAGDDNIDIDILSTSPVGGSPVITPVGSSSRAVTDTEEDLDIDGDIDVGEEEYIRDTSSRSLNLPSGSRNGSFLSNYSLSSLSGEEETMTDMHQNRRTKRPILSSNGTKASTESNSTVTCVESVKLPCKKIWMRSFIKQVTVSKEPHLTEAVIDNVSTDHMDQTTTTTDIKQESLALPTPPEPALPLRGSPRSPVKAENMADTVEVPAHLRKSNEDTERGNVISDIMDVDDGELSDASSASTIPLDHEPDYHMSSEIRSVNDRSAIEPGHIFVEQIGQEEPVDAAANEHSKTEAAPRSPPQLPSSRPLATVAGEGVNPVENALTTERASVPAESDPAPSDKEKAQINTIRQAAASEQEHVSEGTSEQAKPAKVKLSLQEYLSRRAANQGSARESLSGTDTATKDDMQLCNTMGAVDISMETEQPEAIVNQH